MSFLLKIYSEILKNKEINISNSFKWIHGKERKKDKKADTCRRRGGRVREKMRREEWMNEWMSTKQWEKGAAGGGEHTWECFELFIQLPIVRNIKIRFTLEKLPLLRYVKEDWHHHLSQAIRVHSLNTELDPPKPKEGCLFYYLKLLLGQ